MAKSPFLISGWMPTEHMQLLDQLVRKLVPAGDIVEIGSAEGRSAAMIGLAARDISRHLYCIDPWLDRKIECEDLSISIDGEMTFESFKRNMRDVGLTKTDFTYMRCKSLDAVNEFDQVAMVFVDGSHKYHDVKDDFVYWIPKIANDGILAAHDYTNAYHDVVRAWNEAVRTHPRFVSDKDLQGLVWTKLN